jgi:hypothetical protein
MKAFWFRVLSWFFLTFFVVSALFFGATYLIQSRNQPLGSELARAGQPKDVDRRNTGAQVKVVVAPPLLLLYAATIAASFAVAGWLVVRRTFTPIVSLNDQLDAIDPNNLQVQNQHRNRRKRASRTPGAYQRPAVPDQLKFSPNTELLGTGSA